jgi:hypothetical protein
MADFVLQFGVPRLRSCVMRRSWTPSIVPNGQEQTFYIVLCDYGPLGQSYCETSPDRADLETTIADFLSGQYDNPVRVVAFNTTERWSDDVSEDVAREIIRRVDIAGDEMSEALSDFVEDHLGPERQLTLRLA